MVIPHTVRARTTGRLEVADFLDHAKEHPWVAKVEYYVESGTDVIGYDTQVRHADVISRFSLWSLPTVSMP